MDAATHGEETYRKTHFHLEKNNHIPKNYNEAIYQQPWANTTPTRQQKAIFCFQDRFCDLCNFENNS